MGPITLVDKSTIQALGAEVRFLDRYYSLVISPILMRELLSTLAKEPKPNKDWEHTLSILASKVDTLNSYSPPSAHEIARQSMLGNQTPMDGRVPMTGGRTVRSRDGTYGVIFEEPEQKKILRDWRSKNFHDYYKKEAAQIRKVDHDIDLNSLQKFVSEQMASVPNLKTLPDMARWMDENFFRGATPEFHLENMSPALLSADELKTVVLRWRKSKKPLHEFAPYAHYFYRVNMIYLVGLGKGLISASKKANSHLDIQYVYYLPFAMCFTTSDKHLLEIAEVFKREDQIIIPGDTLKADLKAIEGYMSALTEENRVKHSKEFGIYPPELSGSVTATTWKSLMRPRPDPSTPTPKLSKDQEKALVDRMSRYLRESVTVNGPPSSESTKPREKKSIRERNLEFISGVLDKVGAINEKMEWEDIKKRFGSNEVKAIYDLHADLWHPNDPFRDLAHELRQENLFRALYLGDIEPYDLVEQMWRWSLHFDQILIPDPFHSPWARKEEYNPLSNPEQFESDTLKLVYSLILLQPLILSGQVLLVPDPADFDPKLKALNLKLGKQRSEDPIYKEMTMSESDQMKKLFFQTEIRFSARLSLDKRQQLARTKYASIGESDVLKYFDKIRAYDPLCIDRDTKEGEMIIARSGANFDSSLLLSSLYGAIPVSALSCRIKEYQRESTAAPTAISAVAKKLESTPNCKIIDPIFSTFAKDKGALAGFRECLEEIIAKEQVPVDIEELFSDLKEEAKFLAEVFSRKSGIDGERLVEDSKIEMVWSTSRFLNKSATEYINAYDPDLKTLAPKCFLGLPATNMPSLPFMTD